MRGLTLHSGRDSASSSCNGRLAGYGYGFGSGTPKHSALAGLTTARGLALGDSTRRAHTLYGPALMLSYAQAGSYVINTRQGADLRVSASLPLRGGGSQRAPGHRPA